MIRSQPLLQILKNPTNSFLLVGFFLLFFDVNYWLMKNLLGTNLERTQCLPGGALTPTNIVFSIFISFLMAVFVVGMKELFMAQISARQKTYNASVLSFSSFLGFFTVFCPVCTFGVVSLFGLSFSFTLFLDYNTEIKFISLAFLLLGLYWLNQQLKPNCRICEVLKSKKD